MCLLVGLLYEVLRIGLKFRTRSDRRSIRSGGNCDQKIGVNNLKAENEGQLGKISLSDSLFDRDRDGTGETHAVKEKYEQGSDIVCEGVEEQTSKDRDDEVEDVDNDVTSLYCPGSSQLPLGQCSKGLVHSPQCSGVSVGCCRVGEVVVTVIEEEDEHAS